MIVYHKNNEIDREQWDNCIRNSPGVSPYAYSWYLDIMRRVGRHLSMMIMILYFRFLASAASEYNI